MPMCFAMTYSMVKSWQTVMVVIVFAMSFIFVRANVGSSGIVEVPT